MLGLNDDQDGSSSDVALTFEVEWFDPTMDSEREFLLTFYTKDNAVEMVLWKCNCYE